MYRKPKIPLPWAQNEEESNRAKNTLIYWHAERAWNGHNKDYRVGEAIQDVGVILNSTPPGTPLYHLVHALKEDLIQFGTKKSKLRELGVANTNTIAKTFVI